MKNSSKAHILIVDDDPVVVIALSHILTTAGYLTTGVGSGEQALELLESTPSQFGVIILDRKMEKMSGLDVLHELYKRPELKKTPVIMLTSHAEKSDKIAATIAGVFDILIKPVEGEWESLLMAVKRALREKR